MSERPAAPGRAALALAAAAALLPAPLAAQAGAAGLEEPEPPDSAAALYGRVAVRGDGEPLVNAAVELVDRDLATVADSAGRYRFRNLEPGEVTLRVSYLGARTRDRTVTLEAGEAVRHDVLAERTAVEVTELRVEVRRRRRGKMAGFEERRERGRGDFVTREEIERIHPIRTTQIIRRESVGAEVVRTESGRLRLLVGHGPDKCPPAVYLDGGLVTGFRVNDVHPADLEAIEIYDGNEAPSRYDVMRGCGVVLLWTRTGASAEGG